jgi:uncharacterized alpha-E superfamily protein
MDGELEGELTPWDAALAMTMDSEDGDSVTAALARARENARQVRDQLTTETWERLNLIYLRVTGPKASREFTDAPSQFLHDIIADVLLFTGAADATMSHGEGWGFLQLGVFIERAQLTGRLLQAGFGRSLGRPVTEHAAMTALLRMSCALEPYLRKHTADIQVVTELMTPSQRKQRLAAMGADGPTVAEVLAGPGRMDAVASGVVLEAQAKA